MTPPAARRWCCGKMLGEMCPSSALSIWIICCLSSLKHWISLLSTLDRSRLDWRISDSGSFSTAGMSKVGDQKEWVYFICKYIQPQIAYWHIKTSKITEKHKPACLQLATYYTVTLSGLHYSKQANRMTFGNTIWKYDIELQEAVNQLQLQYNTITHFCANKQF